VHVLLDQQHPGTGGRRVLAYLGDDGTDVALTGTTADSPEGIL
jgi:hypothetical protein